MKKLVKFVLCCVFTVLVAACGGGGSSPPSTTSAGVTFLSPEQSTVLPAASDITVATKPASFNVCNADSREKETVFPGQVGVTLVTFCAFFNPREENATVFEIVVEDLNGSDLAKAFASGSISLRYGEQDVASAARYSVKTEGKRATLRFENQWEGKVPDSSKIEVFSFVANINPLAGKAKMQFHLIGVQLTKLGATVKIDNVKGPLLTIDDTVGVPTISSAVPQYQWSPYSDYFTQAVAVIRVTCPSKNVNPCTIAKIDMLVEVPDFAGITVGSVYLYDEEKGIFFANYSGTQRTIAPRGLTVPPGEIKYLQVFAETFGSGQVRTRVTGVTFDVNGKSIAPIVDTSANGCGTVLEPLFPKDTCTFGSKG